MLFFILLITSIIAFYASLCVWDIITYTQHSK